MKCVFFSVSLTCHNITSSPWTECTESCGIGLSTRATHTSPGCQKLSSLRLCQNRQCAIQQLSTSGTDAAAARSHAHGDGDGDGGVVGSEWRFNPNAVLDAHKVRVSVLGAKANVQQLQQTWSAFCRRVTSVGTCSVCRPPAFVWGRACRGSCTGRKCAASARVATNAVCLRCRQRFRYVCAGTLSTAINSTLVYDYDDDDANATICRKRFMRSQVEMLCPLNAGDPLEFIEPTADLWDTTTIDPIDQELMQSHRIPLENRFIDVQWVLKCECTRRVSTN